MPSKVKRLHACRLLERATRNGRPSCAYCGVPVTRKLAKVSDSVRPFTMDHVIPRSQGGIYHDDNLLPACLECNHARGDKPLDRFIAEHPAPAMTPDEARHHMDRARLTHDRQDLLQRGFRR